MTISGGLAVNRLSQVKHLDDSCGTEIKILADDLYEALIGKLSGSKCINIDRGRLCNTDGIGKLDLAFVCQSGCYQVLCRITCCISCGTVYLCTVLSGECAAAVSCVAAVGVDDDLPTGQAAVTMRAADNETSGGVNEELGLIIHQLCGKDRIQNILTDICMDLLLGHIGIMLGRKNDCIQMDRFSVLVILYGYLALSVGTEIF